MIPLVLSLPFGDRVDRKTSKHTCPYCGALYEMTVRRRGNQTYHIAVCLYCGDVMAEWYGCARRPLAVISMVLRGREHNAAGGRN